MDSSSSSRRRRRVAAQVSLAGPAYQHQKLVLRLLLFLRQLGEMTSQQQQ
jgi:hypothetical protein